MRHFAHKGVIMLWPVGLFTPNDGPVVEYGGKPFTGQEAHNQRHVLQAASRTFSQP